jgi:hypothetical protein
MFTIGLNMAWTIAWGPATAVHQAQGLEAERPPVCSTNWSVWSEGAGFYVLIRWSSPMLAKGSHQW